jgi:hypothetical protein
MSESITVRGAAVPDAMTSAQIVALLNQVLSDLANLRTAINAHTHTVQVNSTPSNNVTATSTYSQSSANLLP